MSDVSWRFSYRVCLLVIQRAFGANDIFCSALDYNFFLKLIRQYKKIHQVDLFAFCLLPNAVYLVVNGNDTHVIAQFLDDVNRCFCDFVRVRDEARIDLHIHRSRIVIIEDDRSLIDMVTFVDALPLRMGFVSREIEYEWSSFHLRVLGIENGMIARLHLCS